MVGERRLNQTARQLETGSSRESTLATTAEEALATGSVPTGRDREAIEETHRLARLTAEGRIGEEELAAVGVTPEEDSGEMPETIYDQQVSSYTENSQPVDTGNNPDTLTDDRAGYSD